MYMRGIRPDDTSTTANRMPIKSEVRVAEARLPICHVYVVGMTDGLRCCELNCLVCVQNFQQKHLEFSLQKVKNHNNRKSHSTSAKNRFCALVRVVCGKRGGR